MSRYTARQKKLIIALAAIHLLVSGGIVVFSIIFIASQDRTSADANRLAAIAVSVNVLNSMIALSFFRDSPNSPCKPKEKNEIVVSPGDLEMSTVETTPQPQQ